MLTACADESGSRPDFDPGAYLLTAALCDDEDVAEMRKTLDGRRLAVLTSQFVRYLPPRSHVDLAFHIGQAFRATRSK